MSTTIATKTIRLGALEFSAALQGATDRQDVKIDRAYKDADGYHRIERRDRCADHLDTIVSKADTVKGAWTDGTFVPFTPEALAAIERCGEVEQEGKELRDLVSIEIAEFVPLKSVNFARAEGGYYLAPGKGGLGARPLKLLLRAMIRERVAGLCKFVVKPGGRQKLGVVHAQDGALRVTVLAFADATAQAQEEAAEALDAVAEPPKAHLDHARALVQAMTVDPGSSLLETATDSAIGAKAAALDEALAGHVPAVPEGKVSEATPTSGDDLLAALRRSVEAVGA